MAQGSSYCLCVVVSSLRADGFPVVLDNLWLGREEGDAIAAALGPKLQKTKGAVEKLLYDVATLEVRD